MSLIASTGATLEDARMEAESPALCGEEEASLFCSDCSQILEVLTRTIRSESEALRRGDLTEANSLQAHKRDLTLRLSTYISFFNENGRKITSCAPALVRKLSFLHADLRKAVEESIQLLDSLYSAPHNRRSA